MSVTVNLSKITRRMLEKLLTATTQNGSHELPQEFWTRDEYLAAINLREQLKGNAGLLATDPYDNESER